MSLRTEKPSDIKSGKTEDQLTFLDLDERGWQIASWTNKLIRQKPKFLAINLQSSPLNKGHIRLPP